MKNIKLAVGLMTAAAMTAGMASTAMAAGTLNFGCQNYAGGSVNPLFQESSAWNAMRYGVTEGLFKFTDSMEIEPWLAESYEVSEDHKTWTIKIKDGLKFSDGCDVTAEAVKASFERLYEAGKDGVSLLRRASRCGSTVWFRRRGTAPAIWRRIPCPLPC